MAVVPSEKARPLSWCLPRIRRSPCGAESAASQRGGQGHRGVNGGDPRQRGAGRSCRARPLRPRVRRYGPHEGRTARRGHPRTACDEGHGQAQACGRSADRARACEGTHASNVCSSRFVHVTPVDKWPAASTMNDFARSRRRSGPTSTRRPMWLAWQTGSALEQRRRKSNELTAQHRHRRRSCPAPWATGSPFLRPRPGIRFASRPTGDHAMLDRDQLETFATVAEQQSFERAAALAQRDPRRRVAADQGAGGVAGDHPAAPRQAGHADARRRSAAAPCEGAAPARSVVAAGTSTSADHDGPVPLAIAVNADSLATWLPPLLRDSSRARRRARGRHRRPGPHLRPPAARRGRRLHRPTRLSPSSLRSENKARSNLDGTYRMAYIWAGASTTIWV